MRGLWHPLSFLPLVDEAATVSVGGFPVILKGQVFTAVPCRHSRRFQDSQSMSTASPANPSTLIFYGITQDRVGNPITQSIISGGDRPHTVVQGSNSGLDVTDASTLSVGASFYQLSSTVKPTPTGSTKEELDHISSCGSDKDEEDGTTFEPGKGGLLAYEANLRGKNDVALRDLIEQVQTMFPQFRCNDAAPSEKENLNTN